MIKTPNLKLPIYNTPTTDKFNLEEWNIANENIERAFTSVLNGTKLDMINGEVVEARQGEKTLEIKLDRMTSYAQTKANDVEVRKKETKIELEDMSANALKAISGNTTLNLLSTPQDVSVTIPKLSADLNKSLVIPVSNIILNGDFSDGTTSWSVYSAINTVTNQVLTNKSNGVADFSSLLQTNTSPLIQGNKLYFETRVRVTNSLATSIKLSLRGSVVSGEVKVAEVSSPVVNKWYTLKGFVTVTTQTGMSKLYLNHYYGSILSDNSMEIDYLTGIDTSLIFGVGNEPSQSDIDVFLEKYSKHWFSGEGNWFTAKAVLEKINSNPLDDLLIIDGADWVVE